MATADNKSQSGKYAWFAGVLVLFGLSVLRGARFPNLWSYSHYLFNYEYGFIKRSLLGEIVRQSGVEWLSSYEFFFYFSVVILLANLVLLASLLWDMVRSEKMLVRGCALVFASSMAVVYLVHTIGYFDNIGLLVVLVSLRIRGFYKKMIFLSMAMPACILVHEAILVMFFPVVFMSLVLSMSVENVKKQIVFLGVLSCVVVGLTFIAGSARLDVEKNEQLYEGLETKADAALRHDAFSVLSRGFADNQKIMERLWSQKVRYKEIVSSLCATAPVFVLLMWVCGKLLSEQKINGFLVLLAMLACVSPLTLHFIGWDMHRWNCLAITTSFLMLYVSLSSTKAGREVENSGGILPLIVVMVFLNGIFTIELMDKYQIENFPFRSHRSYLIDVLRGNADFPCVPEK